MGDRELLAGVPEVADHPRRGAEVGEPATTIEKQHLVEQAQHRRAGPVQGGDDDFFPGQRAQRLGDMLGVFRREAGDRFVKQENLRTAAEVHAEIQAAALAAGNGLVARRADAAVGDGL